MSPGTCALPGEDVKPALPAPVKLSPTDRAPQTSITNDLTLSSSRGYRTVRATHGVSSGAWYYEVTVESLGQTGAARIGWATAVAELQGPVGGDAKGYSYRSLEGSKVHAGVRADYGSAWGERDVIGCLLVLPPPPASRTEAGEEAVASASGSVFFFKNGEAQGEAFSGIPLATYYPAVSLYTHASQPTPARVSVNFGATPLAICGGRDGSEALAAAVQVPAVEPVAALSLAVSAPPRALGAA
ncbi:Set1/Ash2 histone methyltransferase complex subunit ASH2 [Auxenochlorella protothecoides]|nr:Set1/Ash2 histone methyltransferase complex subunit ASH2 [Auxenochlorella protothecoides]KFM27687.1 Set1/Ash2 histone methyltransferase complex subunit ASH2 [Auxenochlorella protothecoides]RMZ54318.1 hypothetical protein APUTEX25_001476 [Auxenochlorella protothecoides]|eukprot:RMZ54318.1 hypothetical protein APUTEX25_001476 [Auxenochlorella protothecoides]